MTSRYFALALLPFSFTAAAAQSPEDEVLVTASLEPIALSRSGTAATVITGDMLEERQIDTVFDALRDVPGVAVSRTGTVGSLSQIRMRGGESNHILVLIDGVEANDPATSSEFNFAHLLSAGIERMEVLRGPQSALWGADAVTGVVNILMRAPQAGTYLRGAAEAGSFDTRQFSGLVNVGSARAAAVLDASYAKTAGINVSRTGDEKDGYENLTLGARARVELAPALVLSGSFRHVNGNSDFDGGFPYPQDTGDYTHAAQTYARGEAKTSMLNGAVDATLSAAITRTRSDNFSAGALSDGSKGGKNDFDLLVNTHWAGMIGSLPLVQRFSVLAETAEETFAQRFLSFPAADQEQSLRETGLAAEYWLGYDERVFVSLGARHDWNDRFDDTATWRATLSALLPHEARLHASAGTGIKNPDFFELFGFVPSSFAGNPDLEPERSFGYDAGIELNLFGRARIDMTYFHADLQNEIFTDFAAFPSTARNAGGDSEREGVEIAARAVLAEGFELSAVYTYTQSSNAGAQELRRPNHVGAVDLIYRFAQDRAQLSLGADFHGAQRDTDFGTFTTVTLPGYTLVRAAGAYELGNGVALTARVENALDETYEEVVGYRTRGFGVFAGIRARFGE